MIFHSQNPVAIIGELILILIIGLIMCPISAIIFKIAVRWIKDTDVPFGQAYWTMYISTVISILLNYNLELFFGDFIHSSVLTTLILGILLLPVPFLFQSWIINLRHSFSFSQSSLITLTMYAIYLGIAVVIGIIALGVIYLS